MASVEQDKLTKWQWVQWSIPLMVTIGLFVGTLKLDARRH